MLSHLITFLIPFIHLTYLLPNTLSAILSDAVRAQLEEITCLGGPSQPLPILPSIDPNKHTLQSLCAQGGNYLNIGGYCFRAPASTAPDTSGRVVFRTCLPYTIAPLPGTFSQHLLQVSRFRAECLLRCFCTYTNSTIGPNVVAVPRNLQRQPKYIGSPYPPRLSFPSQQTVQITIDQHDDYPGPNLYLWYYYVKRLNGKHGTYGELNVNFDVVVLLKGNTRLLFHRISIDQNNYIECEGPMPTFELPLPWKIAEFDAHTMHAPNAITALCAVYQSGDYRSANAGGYCYHGTYGSEVWFADEMTPQYTWTWGGPDFFAAAAIRYHCWRHCRCKFPVKGKLDNGTTVRPSSLQKMWDVIDDAAVHFGLSSMADGSLEYRSQSADGNSHSGQVLPPQTGPGSPSGTCGADGRQFCPAQWPAEFVGKVPLAPPEIPNLDFNASDSSINRCGVSLTCHSPAGCGTDINGPCKCVEPDAKTAMKYGLDPIFPSALCLTIMTLSVASSSVSGKRSSRPQLTLNGEGEPWRCFCNETYISSGCCTAQDGLL